MDWVNFLQTLLIMNNGLNIFIAMRNMYMNSNNIDALCCVDF